LDVPEDVDQVYVVDYYHKVSTKHDPTKIADGTYKVIWQKHTLITAGTTDKSKAWHPFGVMPTKRENYCMPAGEETQLSSRDCRKYFNIIDQISWTKFDEYVYHIGTLYFVKFQKEDWLMSRCSCCYWAKNYFCNHVIGLAVCKKKIVYKDVHKEIQIGQNRPRGQPSKTKSALNKQADYVTSSDSSSSSESTLEASPVKASKSKKVPKKTYVKKTNPKKRGPNPKM